MTIAELHPNDRQLVDGLRRKADRARAELEAAQDRLNAATEAADKAESQRGMITYMAYAAYGRVRDAGRSAAEADVDAYRVARERGAPESGMATEGADASDYAHQAALLWAEGKDEAAQAASKAARDAAQAYSLAKLRCEVNPDDDDLPRARAAARRAWQQAERQAQRLRQTALIRLNSTGEPRPA